MILADRALGVFIAVAILGFLEREGLVNPADRSQNVEVLGEILSWIITGVVALIYIIIHRHKKPVVSSETEITVTEKTYPLQKFLTFLKGKFIEEKKTEFSASTGETMTE